MKAKVIETGEIVDVTPNPTWYKEVGQGPDRREWDEDDLEFIRPERKEIDIEEELSKYFGDDWKNYGPKETNEDLIKFANHFYNLGLNRR